MRLVLLYIIFFLIAACRGRVEPVSEYLNLHDSVAYVGKETCMQCHYEIYESYMQTGMGQSFEKSSKERVLPNFDKNSIINDIFKQLSSIWKNDTLFSKNLIHIIKELKMLITL